VALMYRYKAMDQQGDLLTGEIEADNPGGLEHKLTDMQLDLISHKEIRAHHKGRVPRKDLIAFCLHMELITRADIFYKLD